MIAGIGVDMVDITEFKRLAEVDSGDNAFVQRTFTQHERDAAATRPDPVEHLAGCFAVKEAVFKAVADLTPGKTFDLRIVEVLNHESGAPFVNTQGPSPKYWQRRASTRCMFPSPTRVTGRWPSSLSKPKLRQSFSRVGPCAQ